MSSHRTDITKENGNLAYLEEFTRYATSLTAQEKQQTSAEDADLTEKDQK
jgi:hypothetical protein